MSLENEEQRLPDQPAETNHEVHKKVKISYTREFLLSLSELESCKKLPDGFDRSFLSEFEDAFRDRQRTSSGLSANSFRRNDYGSSPPTRGDAAGYSRPLHGRWESRSSGRSDKDSDTQSDKDSDFGRHYGNQSRRPWQVPEHDGLLGSGSFPRPAGFAGGIAAPKVRPNDTYQLNRTNEPYQPPRPYKAPPLTRKEITDSLNDETFGSSDNTSEDRAEEERKRRDSFELMRKEQQKAFQEKQKLKPEKNKGGFDFSSLLDDDSKEEKRLLPRSSETAEPRVPPASNNDGEKSTLPLQTPAPRPLVPPGFASTVLERNIGTKSLNLPHQVEVGNSGLEDNILHGKGNRVVNGTSDNRVEKQPVEQMILGKQHHASASTHASFDSMSGKSINFLPPQGANNKITGMDSRFYNNANTPQALEASRNSEAIEIDAEKGSNSTSILEKLFSGAVPLNGVGSSNIIEPHNSKVDEAVGSHTVNSSKFAQWFHEEDKKPNEILSGRPNDLLSMIVGSEKAGPHIVDGKLSGHGFPSFPTQNTEPAVRPLTSNIIPPSVGDSEHFYKSTKPEAASAVLTCEDLEQSILSEISESGQPPVQRSVVPDRKAGQPKAKVDDHASHHLLSLLQKGTGLRDIEPSSNQETASPEKIHNIDRTAIGTALHISKEKAAENVSDSGKSLTLETLFGTAFMKELQSVGAPVSTKRGLVGSARVETPETRGLPFPVSETSFVPSAFDVGPNTSTHGNSDMTANRRKQTKSDKIDEQLLGFDNPLDSLQVSSDLGSKMGVFDGPADIRLPEEDSLLAVGEPLNIQNFMSTGNLVKSKVFSSLNTEVDIVEKLAALDSAFKDFRDARTSIKEFKDPRTSIMGSQEGGPPFLRGPYDMRRQPDISYQNLNVQPSSQQLHHPQMNYRGTFFHPSDSHPGNANSQMNYMTPEDMIRNDPPQSHQFSANMLRPPFHHSNAAQSGFDARHHPMLQQMHMAGSFPPPHLLQGLSSAPALPPHTNRGAPMPAHPNSQVSGFMEELNPMAGFPFGPRPVNLGGHGMPSPAPDVAGGSNHPEALQRLLEMEMRSNPKQIHPFASSGGHNSQGMYGHELDMGFGYR